MLIPNRMMRDALMSGCQIKDFNSSGGDFIEKKISLKMGKISLIFLDGAIL